LVYIKLFKFSKIFCGNPKSKSHPLYLWVAGVSGSICKTQKTRGNGNQTQKWRRWSERYKDSVDQLSRAYLYLSMATRTQPQSMHIWMRICTV